LLCEVIIIVFVVVVVVVVLVNNNIKIMVSTLMNYTIFQSLKTYIATADPSFCC
jgi:hypothetical protein